MRLDDPAVVRDEYASEERLRARFSVFDVFLRGPRAEDAIVAAVAEARPRRVLEVGCGPGGLAERLARELRVELAALDLSPRMVELTRARGVDARAGDVQALPFPDGSFDCAVAAFVLYHVPDLERSVAELARVLRPGGRLVAATVPHDNLAELWRLLDDDTPREVAFRSENGAAILGRRFDRVERRDVVAEVVFPDSAAIREYVGATITRSHLAARVPELGGPFVATTRPAVFVAEKAAGA